MTHRKLTYGAVSFFSTALQRVMEHRGWTQQMLAEKIGGNQAQVSRYLSATYIPEGEVIDKICAAFNGEDGEDLAIAYLRDAVPHSVRDRVDVIAPHRGGTVKEDVMRGAYERLPGKVRAMLDELASWCERDSEVLLAIDGILRLARKRASC